YERCGFPKLSVRLSLSDPDHQENYLGTKEQWQMAEQQLRELIQERGAEFVEATGEAAFYGPKVDFMTKDSLGRQWQVATIQADRNMPERFDLFCTNEAGEKERIVMVHAAIMGSIERFVSILIEHHAGRFPFWLAPVQVKILPITDQQLDYAHVVAKQLAEAGIRAEIDERSERLNAKIRDAQLEKVPYMFVVGGKEAEAQTIALRSRDEGDLGVVNTAEVLRRFVAENSR
ncbi:threonine--tRNA ligase, partial [Candidatus Woesebacteria bacterium]|nr:threonine--tRNA ligase [Candidatus Woesebacteria bacterium]